jgi:hypothetical protein
MVVPLIAFRLEAGVAAGQEMDDRQLIGPP